MLSDVVITTTTPTVVCTYSDLSGWVVNDAAGVNYSISSSGSSAGLNNYLNLQSPSSFNIIPRNGGTISANSIVLITASNSSTISCIDIGLSGISYPLYFYNNVSTLQLPSISFQYSSTIIGFIPLVCTYSLDIGQDASGNLTCTLTNTSTPSVCPVTPCTCLILIPDISGNTVTVSFLSTYINIINYQFNVANTYGICNFQIVNNSFSKINVNVSNTNGCTTSTCSGFVLINSGIPNPTTTTWTADASGCFSYSA